MCHRKKVSIVIPFSKTKTNFQRLRVKCKFILIWLQESYFPYFSPKVNSHFFVKVKEYREVINIKNSCCCKNK